MSFEIDHKKRFGCSRFKGNAFSGPDPKEIGSDLQVDKSFTINEGTATFTVVSTNNGPEDNTGVMVSDVLHPAFTFVSSSATSGSYDDSLGLWTIGDLASGSSETLTITVKVNQDALPADNTASITGDLEDPIEENNSSTVTVEIPNPVLSFTKSSSYGLITPESEAGWKLGEQFSFYLDACNDGNVPQTNVTITDTVDSKLTVDQVVTTGTDNSSGQNIEVVIPLIEPGKCVRIEVKVTPNVDHNDNQVNINNTAAAVSDQSESIEADLFIPAAPCDRCVQYITADNNTGWALRREMLNGAIAINELVPDNDGFDCWGGIAEISDIAHDQDLFNGVVTATTNGTGIPKNNRTWQITEISTTCTQNPIDVTGDNYIFTNDTSLGSNMWINWGTLLAQNLSIALNITIDFGLAGIPTPPNRVTGGRVDNYFYYVANCGDCLLETVKVNLVEDGQLTDKWMLLKWCPQPQMKTCELLPVNNNINEFGQ